MVCVGRFCQLTAFIVTYVSGRRSDQTGYRVFLLIFAHVDTRHQTLVIKQVVGQCFGKFCLTYTGSTQEDE